MNPSNEFLIELAAWLAQNALNLFVQSTVIIVVGLVAAWLLRKKGSAVQSAVYRATLVCVLVCPLASMLVVNLGFQGWTIRLPQASQMVSVEVEVPIVQNELSGMTAGDPLRIENVPAHIELPANQVDSTNDYAMDRNPDAVSSGSGLAEEPNLSEASAASAPFPVVPLTQTVVEFRQSTSLATVALYSTICAMWLVGCLALLIRLAFAYRGMARIRQQSIVASEVELELCEQLADRIQVSAPEVARNSLLASPCLIGITSPAILLPAEIKGQVPMDKAFAHELAHLRRHDTFWNLIQRIALALFFFQPLLWRLVYRLETTAEEVCDDYVVRHCMDRTGYAQQLVELAESNLLAPEMASLAMFKSQSLLGHRVIRILDSTRKLTTQISRPAVIGIVALAIVAALLGGFLGNGHSPLSFLTGAVNESEENETATETETEQIQVSGVVRGPAGQPVEGATLKVFARTHGLWKKGEPEPIKLESTDENGRFSFEIAADQLPVSREPENPFDGIYLTALADGFGIGTLEFAELQPETGDAGVHFSNLEIALCKSEVPIELTLVDTEGNPIVGATARVSHIYELKNNDPQPLIEGLRKGVAGQNVYREYVGDWKLFHNGLEPERSDENGVIRFSNIGDNRLALIDVQHKSIAIRSFSLLTTEFDGSLELVDNRMGLRSTTEFYGAKSTIACEPTQPIVGIAKDLETGEPLADVWVVGSMYAGSSLAGQRKLKVKTDEEGRFELYGMPKGVGNWITAVPGNDIPYFTQRIAVPNTPGLDVIEMDVPLQRGVWIRGKVTDKSTGDPVPFPRIIYSPFSDNPFAANSPAYDDDQFATFQERYMSDANGDYQIVGFKGGGLIGLSTYNNNYPNGMGWDDIDDSKKDLGRQVSTTLDLAEGFSPSGPTAMKQIDIPEDRDEFEVNFELESGMSVDLRLLDEDGQPLQGVVCRALHSIYDHERTVDSSLVAAGSFREGQERYVMFRHDERGIGRAELIQSSYSKNRDPMDMILQPYSAIKGKLVDANGDPVIGAAINLDVGGGRDFGIRIRANSTNENGEFEIKNLPLCDNYSVIAMHQTGIVIIGSKIEVGAGELIDFGTIDITVQAEQEPTRSKLIQESDESKGSDSESSDQMVKISGQVIDSQGNPVEAVKASFAKFDGFSDAAGNFSIEIPKSKLTEYPQNSKRINVFKNGYGLTTFEIDLQKLDGYQVAMIDDQRPIKGTLVDAEGNPVAGATIQVEDIREFAGQDLEKVFHDSKTDDQVISRLPKSKAVWAGFLQPVKTDSAGKFQIDGIGDNRMALLAVSGDRIAMQRQAVSTTTIDSIEKGNFDWPFDDYQIHGHQVTVVCEPSQPISGQIVDKNTGQPIAGLVAVGMQIVERSPGMFYQQELHETATKTDADGRFRVTGLNSTGQRRIVVRTPTDDENVAPYFNEAFDVTDETGVDEIEMKLELTRGVWVYGQVTDRETGEPLKTMQVDCGAFPENENVSILEVRRQAEIRPFNLYTDSEGKFRLVAMPGPALLRVVRDQSGKYPLLQGYDAIDENRKSNQGIMILPNVVSPGIACQEIEVPAASDLEVNFKLTQGESIRVKLVDPDGKTVDGAEITGGAGRDFYTVKNSEFEINGFLPNGKRTVVFQHAERKLGAIANVGPELTTEEGVIEVQLQRMATVSARMVDNRGQPAQHALLFERLTTGDRSFARGRPSNPSEDGRVTKYLIPGRYMVSFNNSKGNMGYKKIEVVAGQTADFGDIDVTKRWATNAVVSPENWIAQIPLTDLDNVNQPSDDDDSKMMQESDHDSDDQATSQPKANKSIGQLTAGDFAGTIRSPTGQPIAAANVRLFLFWRIEGGRVMVAKEIDAIASNNDGRFSLTATQQDLEILESQHAKSKGGYTRYDDAIARGLVITAESAGFGPSYYKIEGVMPKSEIDLKLSAAEIPILGTVVDLEGNPVANAEVKAVGLFYGTALGFGFSKPVKTDAQGKFEVHGVGDQRTLPFQISGDNIVTKFVQIATAEREHEFIDPETTIYETNQKFGNQPVISVERGHRLTGRVTDVDSGQPIAGATVSYGYHARKQAVLTDSDGNYRLPPIATQSEQDSITIDIVATGQEYFETRIRNVTTPEQQPDAVDAEFESEIWRHDIQLKKAMIVKGKLIDRESGQGIAGTLMYYPHIENPMAEEYENFDLRIRSVNQANRAVTDENGDFSIRVIEGKGLLAARANEFSEFANAEGDLGIVTLEDASKYYHLFLPDRFNRLTPLDIEGEEDVDRVIVSLGKAEADPQDNANATNSNQPIKGRVVDLEGQGVADAKITVYGIKLFGKSLGDRWLDALQSKKNMHAAYDSIEGTDIPDSSFLLNSLPEINTQRDGSFEIQGVPAHAIVEFRVEHPNVTTKLTQVINRSIGKIEGDPLIDLQDNQPLVIAQPSRPITGTVVDLQTGEPIIGARIVTVETGLETDRYHPNCETDQQGRFQLLGLPKSTSTRLCVLPPVDSSLPYLTKDIDGLPDAVDFQPLDLKIELPRGIWISGQVSDLRTGQPVADARLQYSPTKSNPRVENMDDYLQYYSSWPYDRAYQMKTDRLGNYRIAGLPGPGVIMVNAAEDSYRVNVGYDDVLQEYGEPAFPPELIRKIQTESPQLGVDLDPNYKVLQLHAKFIASSYATAWAAIDPTDGSTEYDKDIQLDSGFDVELSVVGPTGQPIESFTISNHSGALTDNFTASFKNGTAKLSKMAETETRQITIRAKQMGLAAVAQVSGDLENQTDKVVTLVPYGKITGRLIDQTNDEPLTKFSLSASNSTQSIESDKNGAFEISDVIFDEKRQLRLTVTKPDGSFRYVNFDRDKIEDWKAGETLDLGTIAVDPRVDWLNSGAGGKKNGA